MNLIFAPQAWEDYLYWQQTDAKTVTRIHQLIKDVLRSPFLGLGKPEPLRHAMAGYWSRRINAEHRIVYKVLDGSILIAQLRITTERSERRRRRPSGPHILLIPAAARMYLIAVRQRLRRAEVGKQVANLLVG
jgi:toxin YoeB